MRYISWLALTACLSSLGGGPAQLSDCRADQPLVPGSGQKSDKVGDDFEDEKWTYYFNNPKSSHEQDDQIRHPAGGSANGRWSESAKRGHPDVIQRVPTPEGGLAGSQGALKLRTLQSGIPNRISGQNMQDDLIVNVTGRLNGYVPVSNSPSIVVRVFLPPFDQWEQRTGNSFGLRGSLEKYHTYERRRETKENPDSYWPGIFIYFYSKADFRTKDSFAQLLLRADARGHDFWGPKITEPGWWTLGMSFTPDGQVHYYAHRGVEDLTAADHLSSQFPYGYRAEKFQSFFFDLVNRDDGSSWSTSWIIDDPSLYFLHNPFSSQPVQQQFNGRRR
jgi:hypothetical protein